MDLEEERKRVGERWLVFPSTDTSKGRFEYRKPGDSRKTWNSPPTCSEYAEQDRFHGIYRAPEFFNGTVEDYVRVVEEYPDAHELRSKLRADVDDDTVLGSDATLLAEARVRMYQRDKAAATTPSARDAAEERMAIWQHETQRAVVAAQQRFLIREQDKAGPLWRVRYDTDRWRRDKVHRAIYHNIQSQQDFTEAPCPLNRYICAVEDPDPSLEREHELDIARDNLPVRTCIDTARSRREDFHGWELELKFLYAKVVTDQGTEYSAAGCQLVAITRHVYGVDLAIEEASTRDNRFDPEWKAELYLALLLKHRGENCDTIDEARADLPRAVVLGLSAYEEHLGMQRALGTERWCAERDRLQACLDEAEDTEESHPPQKRRRVRTGAGALPFLTSASSRVLALERPVLSTHEQEPDESGYVPFRTNEVVMTLLGKNQCVLEAVRFATACRYLSRDTFGLPKHGDVNMKALVDGARRNPDFPFTFVKIPATTWAGLPGLPWGIYIGRVVVGTFSHMIVYCTWRHLLFLGGDSSDSNAACRGWHLEQSEIDDPSSFEAFMRNMLGPQLQNRVDAVYRVDVHAKRLSETCYC